MLHLASKLQNIDVVRILIKKHEYDVNILCELQTCFHVADLELFKVLIELEADFAGKNG